MKVISLVMALILVSGPAMAASKPNAVMGKVTYTQNCMGCHGDKGQGGVGEKLAGEASKWKLEIFSRAMLEGKDDHGMTLKAPMPVFGKVGFGGSGKKPSSTEIANLFAYIQSFK